MGGDQITEVRTKGGEAVNYFSIICSGIIKSYKDKKGFTLIELIIAIAISGMLIAAAYTTVNSITKQFDTRSGQVRTQNDLRLALHWLTQDLQDVSPDKVIEGIDPLYDINGVKYRAVENNKPGSKNSFDIVRESAADGKITLIESVAEEDGFIINLNISESYYKVNIINVDRYNKDKTTEFIIHRRGNVDIPMPTKIIAVFSDDIIKMATGNKKVDSSDSTWTLKLENATFRPGVTMSDFTIDNTSYPGGLRPKVLEVIDTKTVKITFDGEAIQAMSNAATVRLIVKSSAVNETNLIDSSPIQAKIIPSTAIRFNPGNYVLYTSDLIIEKNVDKIQGDVMVGSGFKQPPTPIVIKGNPQSEFYGKFYFNRGMSVDGNITFGSLSKTAELYVNGTAEFIKKSTINGKLYYKNIAGKKEATVNGEIKQLSTVNIPQIYIPSIEELGLNLSNYVVINNPNTPVSLKSNTKYFFNCDYEFKNSYGDMKIENVVIVGKGNLTFNANSKFTASGIIFAPNGSVKFVNGCNVTGNIASRSTTLGGNNVTLIYADYYNLLQ